MMQFLFESLVIGLLSGIIAAVYRGVLAYQPILNWWFRFGNRFEKKWFFAPIWGCVLCIAGQIGLWATVFIKILPAVAARYGQISKIAPNMPIYISNPVALLFGLISAVCVSIFIAGVLHDLINTDHGA